MYPKLLSLYFIFLTCTISTLSAQSKEDFGYLPQFAIINDPDGFTNIRDKNKNIIGKIYKDEIFTFSFLIEDTICGYLPIEWKLNSKGEISETGYIHNSRIEYLYKLPLLKRKIIHNSAVFEKDHIKITIHIGTFNIDDKRISKSEYGYPLKIDGYDAWGTACFSREDPDRNTEIKSIEYTIDGVTQHFEKKDISGYLFPSLENTFVSVGNDNTLYIAMNNGDGAGSYSLLWVLKDGTITQKIVYRGF